MLRNSSKAHDSKALRRSCHSNILIEKFRLTMSVSNCSRHLENKLHIEGQTQKQAVKKRLFNEKA